MTKPQLRRANGRIKKIGGDTLYRSITNRSVAGVCGGLGERFGVDVGVVRIVWLASIFLTLGVTLLAYIVMALAVPNESLEHAASKPAPTGDLWQRIRQNNAVLWGVILLLIGALLLVNNIGLLPWRLEQVWGVIAAIFWPLLLLSVGAYLLLSFTGRAPDVRQLRQMGAGLPLRRTSQDRVIAGVCGGVGRYFNIDPLVVRIGWAVFTVATVGVVGVLIYAAAALLIPLDEA